MTTQCTEAGIEGLRKKAGEMEHIMLKYIRKHTTFHALKWYEYRCHLRELM
jgi:hypothetical protein